MKRLLTLVAGVFLSTMAFADVAGIYKAPDDLAFLQVSQSGNVIVVTTPEFVPGEALSNDLAGLNVKVWGYGVGLIDPATNSANVSLEDPFGLCKLEGTLAFTETGATFTVTGVSETAAGTDAGINCAEIAPPVDFMAVYNNFFLP